jgi:hypothetical protein
MPEFEHTELLPHSLTFSERRYGIHQLLGTQAIGFKVKVLGAYVRCHIPHAPAHQPRPAASLTNALANRKQALRQQTDWQVAGGIFLTHAGKLAYADAAFDKRWWRVYVWQ